MPKPKLFCRLLWPACLIVLFCLPSHAATVRRAGPTKPSGDEAPQETDGALFTSITLQNPNQKKPDVVWVDWTARQLRAQATGRSSIAAGEPQQLAPRAIARADAHIRAQLKEAVKRLSLGDLGPPAPLPKNHGSPDPQQSVALLPTTLSPLRLGSAAIESRVAVTPTFRPMPQESNGLDARDDLESRTVGSIIDAQSQAVGALLSQTVGRYQAEETTFGADGSVHLRIVLPFDGGSDSLGGVWATLRRERPSQVPAALRSGLGEPKAGQDRRVARVTQRLATGLVIQAKGLGVSPCLWPRIFGSDGRLLLGAETLEESVFISRGVVSFSTSLEAALRDPRVADQAVVVRATDKLAKSLCDLVLNSRDLPEEGALTPIISEARVVIVIDPPSPPAVNP